MHEYSHYLVWLYSQPSDSAHGPHDPLQPIPTANVGNGWNRAIDLAYNEALASFIGGAMRNSSSYTDSIHNVPFTEGGILAEWEDPKPDAPWVRFISEWNGPSGTVLRYPGERSEGGLNAMFWDIFDQVNDGNFVQSGQIYGHNNDFNSSSSWQGFSAIWDILTNYDPRPASSAQERTWNVYDFVQGWRDMGYSVDQQFTDILESHGIPVFLAGDADGNGIVNIGDVTALIGQIFSSVLIPYPQAQGDSDGNCSITIGDVTYLVDRIFTSGPAPIPGCVDPPYIF